MESVPPALIFTFISAKVAVSAAVFSLSLIYSLIIDSHQSKAKPIRTQYFVFA